MWIFYIIYYKFNSKKLYFYTSQIEWVFTFFFPHNLLSFNSKQPYQASVIFSENMDIKTELDTISDLLQSALDAHDQAIEKAIKWRSMTTFMLELVSKWLWPKTLFTLMKLSLDNEEMDEDDWLCTTPLLFVLKNGKKYDELSWWENKMIKISTT